MKMFKNILVELILPFILCWFFMSVLVDIVAIPTVFKNVSSLEEGGRIGMTIFGHFNSFEIFFAVFIFLGLISLREKSKSLITLSVLLIGLSLFYKFYMTPLIAQTSIKIHQITATDPQYQILEAQHNYFHALYRSFDTAKLLILLIFSGLITRLNIKKLHKESV